MSRASTSPAALRRLPCALLVVAVMASGCDASPAPAQGAAPGHPAHAATTSSSSAAGAHREALEAVARVHGGAGPWAVAGYRMGEHALERLGLRAQSFDLEVVHKSPREVQYSCIADGAAAATGASLGKLNLSLEPADEAHMETVYRRKSDGKEVRLRLTERFKQRFEDVPRERLAAAGREVIDLAAGEIFEDVR